MQSRLAGTTTAIGNPLIGMTMLSIAALEQDSSWPCHNLLNSRFRKSYCLSDHGIRLAFFPHLQNLLLAFLEPIPQSNIFLTFRLRSATHFGSLRTEVPMLAVAAIERQNSHARFTNIVRPLCTRSHNSCIVCPIDRAMRAGLHGAT